MATEGSKRANRPPFWRRWHAQIRCGWIYRDWPWNVPWQVVYISFEKPPPEVFAYFRKLHGIED